MANPSLESISFVINSYDDNRFAAFERALRSAFPWDTLDVIRIPDAISMAEGLNRGARLSSAEWLIFCHDDIRILNRNAHAVLQDAIGKTDMFGPCGTTRVTSGNWYDAGQPYIFGHVVAPDVAHPGRYELQLFGLSDSSVHLGGQALDGLWIGCRRALFDTLGGFDASRYTNFVGYDVDFSFRGALAGARVGIACELTLFHDSHVGEFSSEKLKMWGEAQALFEASFGKYLDANCGERTHTTIVLKRPQDALNFLSSLPRLTKNRFAKRRQATPQDVFAEAVSLPLRPGRLYRLLPKGLARGRGSALVGLAGAGRALRDCLVPIDAGLNLLFRAVDGQVRVLIRADEATIQPIGRGEASLALLRRRFTSLRHSVLNFDGVEIFPDGSKAKTRRFRKEVNIARRSGMAFDSQVVRARPELMTGRPQGPDITATPLDDPRPRTTALRYSPEREGRVNMLVSRVRNALAYDPGWLLAPTFLLMSLLGALFLVWNTPPFMMPDEPNHAMRARQISLGGLVGEKIEFSKGAEAGGVVDSSLADLAAGFSGIRFHYDQKASLEFYKSGYQVKWAQGKAFQDFPNTAVYGPVLYGPSALGFVIGEKARLRVLDSFFLARGLNAAACIILGLIALVRAGRTAPWLYSLLLLPMTLALFAEISQDGLLITFSALVAALFVTAKWQGRPLSVSEGVLGAICIVLMGMGKAPYAALSLLIPLVPMQRPLWRWPLAAASAAVAIGWTVWMMITVQAPLSHPLSPGEAPPDPASQISYLLGHPLAVLSIGWNTMIGEASHVSREFIGVLGWVDTKLPTAYYAAATIILALSAVLAGAGFHRLNHLRFRILVLLVVLACAALVAAALYLSWTPIGLDHVEGLQGRYFLPLAPFLLLAFYREAPSAPWPQALRNLGLWLVMLFPVVSLLTIEHAIIWRYFLG